MGENEKQRRLNVIRLFFIILHLVVETIPGVIECINLVEPEGFFIEGVESQSEAYEKTEKKDKYLFLFWLVHSNLIFLRYRE